jgi:competence protein ComEA
MKTWQAILLGIFFGLLSSGLVLLLTSQPVGDPIKILPPPTPSAILVHVTGGVTNPGVQKLDPDSRVEDAIKAAGGFSPSADQSLINLAAHISDGQKLVIPVKGETKPDEQSSGTPPARAASNVATSDNPAIININTAAIEQLDLLPGIGSAKAASIVAYREKNGTFNTIEDITNVPGIGPAIFEAIKNQITVED